jgi:hypothetical protein
LVNFVLFVFPIPDQNDVFFVFLLDIRLVWCSLENLPRQTMTSLFDDGYCSPPLRPPLLVLGVLLPLVVLRRQTRHRLRNLQPHAGRREARRWQLQLARMYATVESWDGAPLMFSFDTIQTVLQSLLRACR